MSANNTTPVLFDENEIFDEGDDRRRTAINRALSFVDQAGVRVVLHWHEPLFRFALSDTLTLRYVNPRLTDRAPVCGTEPFSSGFADAG